MRMLVLKISNQEHNMILTQSFYILILCSSLTLTHKELSKQWRKRTHASTTITSNVEEIQSTAVGLFVCVTGLVSIYIKCVTSATKVTYTPKQERMYCNYLYICTKCAYDISSLTPEMRMRLVIFVYIIKCSSFIPLRTLDLNQVCLI